MFDPGIGESDLTGRAVAGIKPSKKNVAPHMNSTGSLRKNVSPGRLMGLVVRDFFDVLKPLIVFEVLFKSAVVAVGALGTAWVISPLVESTGKSAVTNTDITRFIVSPAGILTGVIFGLSLLIASMIEHVGVISIGATRLEGRDPSLSDTIATLRAVAMRVVSFGFTQLAMLALLCLPFLALAGAAYFALLTRHDINYYLDNRPPSWYAALATGVVLATALGVVLVLIYVSTILAVPILLLEGQGVREAVRESRARTAGARWRIGIIVLGWQLLGTLLGTFILWGFGRSCGLLLVAAESRPVILVSLVALLLAIHAILLAGLSFVVVSIHGLLVLRLYLQSGGTPRVSGPAAAYALLRWADPLTRRLIRLKVGVFLGMPVLIGLMALGVSRRIDVNDRIFVVAHRGYSRVAPENSMSAFKKAIEVGADMIELDVQETSDGAVVVLHDRDLMRLAGDSRAIARLSLADAQKLDIGRRLGPEFAGERIATLNDVIELARDKIKLQIELKYYGADRGLAEKVADLIARAKFEDQCEISSLDYKALLKAGKRNPRLKLVALVTYAVGDPGRLDVGGLSVNTKVLSDRLIRDVAARGKVLYAWTVDDPREMVRLIERGVGRLVTNAPDELIRIREQRAQMSDFERRLMAARYLLGVDPEP
jgi:glycerophosphoryl diester phosphodiesterase